MTREDVVKAAGAAFDAFCSNSGAFYCGKATPVYLAVLVALARMNEVKS